MKLAIYDKGGGDFLEKARPAAIAILGEDDVPPFDPPIADAVDKLREFTHVVCHLSDKEDPSWDKLVDGDLAGVKVIIRVSSRGASGMSDSSFKSPYRLNNTGPWILHLIESSADVSEERWKEIFVTLKNWEADKQELSSDVAAIFDPHPEAQLALRLLCEAWLMNEGVKEKAHSGIVIHAPANPKNWFIPFDESATPEAAARVANYMGKAHKAAEDFLNNIVGLAQAGKDVQGASVKESVLKLQAALETATIA